jgi:hypothetical protein
MTNNFWKLAKVSPVILGASLFLASGANAAETNLGESAINPVVNIGEVSTTPLAFSVPAASQITASTTIPSADLALSTDEINVSDLITPGAAVGEPVMPADANGQALQQIETYNNDVQSLGQVTNISQLRDVSPRDWAFEALRNLVERYQCI